MRSEGLTVPAMVDPNSRTAMSRLQSLRGAAFNRAYMADQVRAHGQMQILMQSETNAGHDARLRAYARATLSTVNEHLAIARSDVAVLRGRHGAAMGSMGGMSGCAMSTPRSGPSSSGSTAPQGGAPGNAGASSGSSMSSPNPMSSAGPSGTNASGAPTPGPAASPHAM